MKIPVPIEPDDPINWTLLYQNSSGFRKIEANDRTQNILLLVALALQAYKFGHGAHPSTLSQLVPGYLQEVPNDPFAPDAPLHYENRDIYENTDLHYLLYSVGPDGKDDSGTPIYDPRGDNDVVRQYVTEGSKGDIVAGTNM
jgi:hypothetical protein